MAKKRTTTAKKTTAAAAIAKLGPPLETLDVELDWIEPSPYQPRMDFPAAEIAALGQELAGLGQLHPIAVRRVGVGHLDFELLDGERRLRAAKTAAMTTLRAEVFEATDAQARQIVLSTALHRQDLSPIEEARAYRTALVAGDAAGPTELARQLNVSQGQVSNALRLLDLPQSWIDRLISREITARHARAVLPFKDYPDLLAALERAIGKEIIDSGEPFGTADWEREVIPEVVRQNTRSLRGPHGDGFLYDPRRGRVSIFQPTVKEHVELAMVELDSEQRASNTELFDRLQEEHAERELASRREAEESLATDEHGSDTNGEEEGLGSSDLGLGEEEDHAVLEGRLEEVYQQHLIGKKKLGQFEIEFIHAVRDGSVHLLFPGTVAWDQALAILEGHDQNSKTEDLSPKTSAETSSETPHRDRAEMVKELRDNREAPAAGESLGEKIYAWRQAWTRKLIAEELPLACEVDVMRLLVLASTCWTLPVDGEADLDALLAEARAPRKKSLTEQLFGLEAWDAGKVAAGLMARRFYTEDEGPIFDVPAADMEEIALRLEIDLEEAWAENRVLARVAYLDLHTTGELLALAKEMKLELPKSALTMSKKNVVAAIEKELDDHTDGFPMPKEIARAKPRKA